MRSPYDNTRWCATHGRSQGSRKGCITLDSVLRVGATHERLSAGRSTKGGTRSIGSAEQVDTLAYGKILLD